LPKKINPDLADVITKFRAAVDFDPTLGKACSDTALFSLTDALTGRAFLDFLVVEKAAAASCGADSGIFSDFVPFETWARDLAAASRRVVIVGPCPVIDRVPAMVPLPSGCGPISSVATAKPLIYIPGCPPYADGVLLTLATLPSGSAPALDRRFRPRVFSRERIPEDGPLKNDQVLSMNGH